MKPEKPKTPKEVLKGAIKQALFMMIKKDEVDYYHVDVKFRIAKNEDFVVDFLIFWNELSSKDYVIIDDSPLAHEMKHRIENMYPVTIRLVKFISDL